MAKQQHDIALSQLNALFNLGSLGSLTDGELLKLFTARRDEAAALAFAVLIDRHGPMVLRVCRAVLRDSHDAEDAFQATFLVLVQKARGLWVRECLGPWLYQVAHRTASGARSARARRCRLERLAARSPVDGSVVEAHDDLGHVLHDEVARLPELYRVAVVLCLLEGLTPEQAAARLGWPAGTVHSRFARGRARLRDRLRSRGLAPEMHGMDSEPTVAPAAVPPALITATELAATRVAAGETLARVASASVVSLTKKGLHIHMFPKSLVAAGATLAAGIAVTAAGVLAYQPTARPDVAPTASRIGKASQEGPQLDIIPKNAPQRPVIQKREVAPLRGQAMSLALSRIAGLSRTFARR
jgi:RNA polymerase sigma factor (sigma-70 family)